MDYLPISNYLFSYDEKSIFIFIEMELHMGENTPTIFITITKRGAGHYTFTGKDQKYSFTYDPKTVDFFPKKGRYTAAGIIPTRNGKIKSDGFTFDFIDVLPDNSQTNNTK